MKCKMLFKKQRNIFIAICIIEKLLGLNMAQFFPEKVVLLLIMRIFMFCHIIYQFNKRWRLIINIFKSYNSLKIHFMILQKSSLIYGLAMILIHLIYIM